MNKFVDFDDFNMNVMRWVFGMLVFVVYFVLSWSDIVPMTDFVCYALILYGYGGFFGLILYQARKK